jgi:hypothetical protein
MQINSRILSLAILLALTPAAYGDGVVNSGGITAGQVQGTATNDNAAAGKVGEIITATVAQGSAVTLTTATPANITSVALTAGDWDCNAVAGRTFGATTSLTIMKTSLNTTTAADGTIATGTMVQQSTPAQVPVTDTTQQIGLVRFSLSAGASVFLVADDTFTISTNKGYGFLRCRRMR